MAPTLAQLQAEPYWNREERPPTLVGLGQALQAHYGVGPAAIGIKGDQSHLSGGHRSPEWIRRSRYSSRGSSDGSLITSTGAIASADSRVLRALDLTPGAWGTAENRRRMAAITTSLDTAVRAGKLPQVRRFWGTRDGRTVYGWDTWYRGQTTSDTSHLDHLHVEMYPDRAGWDHTAVFTAITGGDDMSETDITYLAWRVEALTNLRRQLSGGPESGAPVPMAQLLLAVKDGVTELLARPQSAPAPVDVEALAAALTPHLEAAAERAVRRVLGAVDGATPPGS